MRWLQARNCVQVARLVFYTADTTSTRLFLGWASLLYALILVWPLLFTSAGLPDWLHFLFSPTRNFERPAYAIMAVMPGKEWTWAALLTLHWAGVHWRIIERKERVLAGICVNTLGFALWCYSTLSLCLGLGRIPAGVSLEIVMIVFSGWALYRTGIGREVVTA